MAAGGPGRMLKRIGLASMLAEIRYILQDVSWYEHESNVTGNRASRAGESH
jgi:hypothetical protein